MSCGENLAEASMRDRGCGSAWWTRGWWRALVIEDRDLNTRQLGEEGEVSGRSFHTEI